MRCFHALALSGFCSLGGCSIQSDERNFWIKYGGVEQKLQALADNSSKQEQLSQLKYIKEMPASSERQKALSYVDHMASNFLYTKEESEILLTLRKLSRKMDEIQRIADNLYLSGEN